MTDINTKLLLGKSVTYVGLKGHRKAAIVLGTPESTEPGHVIAENPETGEKVEIPQPDAGHLNLMVVSYSGFSPRFNVPYRDQAFDVASITEETEESDNLLLRGEVGYWVLTEDDE